jgi:hypothetical protein
MTDFKNTLHELQKKRETLYDPNAPKIIDRHEFRDNFPLYADNIAYNSLRTYNNILGNIATGNELNRVFMSQLNIDKVQQIIKKKVYFKSNNKYLIDDQSKDEILLLMRSVYLEHALNMAGSTTEQVNELNIILVREAIPIILSNVDMHYHHVAFLNKPQFSYPVPHPQNVSRKGERSLIGTVQRFPLFKNRNVDNKLKKADRKDPYYWK